MLNASDLPNIRIARERGARWSDLAGLYGYKGGDQLRTAAGRLSKKAGDDAAIPRGKGETVFEESEDGLRTLTSRGSRIRTPEELVAATNLDLDRWVIKRAVVNKWETGIADRAGGVNVGELWQVKLWLEPSPLAPALKLIEELLAGIPAISPRTWNDATGIGNRARMAEVCIFDLHLGRLSWAQESGADWDSGLARHAAVMATRELVGYLRAFGVSKILLPLGNDLLHADATIAGSGGATTKGTPLDVDSRWQAMFRAASEVCREIIEICAQVAPIHAVIVPGNHDSTRMFFLGDLLAAWYRNEPRVTIENNPTPRKYFKFGNTLLGLAHGHNEKVTDLPLLMAQESPGEWASTRHREWHIGHRHSAALQEVGGVRIRTIPSLSAPDAWHAEKGYRNVRTAEAYIWDESAGFIGMFSSAGEVE